MLEADQVVSRWLTGRLKWDADRKTFSANPPTCIYFRRRKTRPLVYNSEKKTEFIFSEEKTHPLVKHRLTRYIPSEKIGQNIDPLRNSFFLANYQHWTSTSALEPFLGPLDPWGALGGPWVVWGGLTTPKLPFSFEDQFKPWNWLFWLITTSYPMFLRFWVKMGPRAQKKGWGSLGLLGYLQDHLRSLIGLKRDPLGQYRDLLGPDKRF